MDGLRAAGLSDVLAELRACPMWRVFANGRAELATLDESVCAIDRETKLFAGMAAAEAAAPVAVDDGAVAAVVVVVVVVPAAAAGLVFLLIESGSAVCWCNVVAAPGMMRPPL